MAKARWSKSTKVSNDTAVGGLRLLTFNTWGLRFVSKHRQERLHAIADKLAAANQYDVVALQEVWSESDWQYIEARCKDVYPYMRYFKSGIVAGSGLALLSRIPIEESFLYRFPINGRPSAFFRGDWLVGKGVAVSLLKGQNTPPIAILNSHMHAPYGTGDSSYSCHRACQAWDISRIILLLKKAGYAVVQVGDLNSRPGSLQYKLFTVVGGLSDSWEICRSQIYSSKEIAEMTPEDQVNLGGVTCDSQLNTWRAQRNRSEACRLDYALIDASKIKPVEAKVEFTEKMTEPNISYSDHFAYYVNLEIVHENAEHVTIDEKEDDCEDINLEVYRELIAEIEQYRTHTIPFQANWRKYHFFASIIAIIAIHVTVGFLSTVNPFASVSFIFLSTFIGITGVVNGMIWFFGVRSESRALQEVQSEVENSFASLNITEPI